MFFSDIIGQKEIKNKLRASLKSGRIPHAQLFYGPEGSGTLPLAVACAQFIACTGMKEDDSCGTCPSCQKFAKLIHPDLHFAFPVNTTSRVTKDPTSNDFISEWRDFVITNPYFGPASWYNFIGIENKQGLISKKEADLIIQKLNLRPFESDFKFMIIWLLEKMNPSAANHLLKLIEEPPLNTIFLLVSDDPDQVLRTIASRTQPVKLSCIDEDSMMDALKADGSLSTVQIKNIAHLANGNYIKALNLLSSSDENEFNFGKFVNIMRYCWSREYLNVNEWVEEMAGLGRERLKSFFNYALRLVRENFISNTGITKLLYMTDKEEEFSAKFHSYINGSNITRLFTEINRASTDIERNAYPKIVLFDFSLQVMKLIRM